jgi:membrane protease YdiL (CAAX protease family)
MNNAGLWQESSPYSKLLITVGMVLLSTIAFTFLSIICAVMFFHISIADLQTLLTDTENPNSLNVLKLVQTFSSIGSFVIPPLILAYLFSQNTKAYLKLDKGLLLTDVLLVLTAMFACVPLINYLVELNEKMALPQFLHGLEEWMRDKETAAAEITERFLDVKSAGALVMNVIIAALIPAIGEELLFRGILQRIFSEWFRSAFLGILVSSILFSALHLQFYGFVPRMMLGILLGYMLLWSGSLWLPMVAHFINNAAAGHYDLSLSQRQHQYRP